MVGDEAFLKDIDAFVDGFAFADGEVEAVLGEFPGLGQAIDFLEDGFGLVGHTGILGFAEAFFFLVKLLIDVLEVGFGLSEFVVGGFQFRLEFIEFFLVGLDDALELDDDFGGGF